MEKSALVLVTNVDLGIEESVIDTYVNSLSTASVAELYVTCGGVLLQMFSFKIMTALIFILSYGRIVEIFLMISVSPIAFATFGNKEWGQIGVNYLKGLLALAFQGYFIMVLVAIYVALLDGITHTSNVAAMVGNLLFVTLLFCFGFFKTASLSKQIFTVR